MKIVFIPGNGGCTPQDNWFPYLEHELPKIGVTVVNKQFPDAILARKEYWLPFITNIGTDEGTILVGHSSGAIAAMRYAENSRILGSILVSAYHTTLGMKAEVESHYFDSPWNWAAIKRNQKWIIQFASTDDPFIPIEEARFINEKLGTEYYEYTDKNHFGYGGEHRFEFPEIIEVLKKKIASKT
jgi:uncharacterized protein